MSDRILFVDDDPNLLAAFQRNLRKKFSFDIALGGDEALRLLQCSGPYALVLADMNMPGMSGIELLEKVATLSPATVRMMLTGNADQQTAVDAVNRGRVFSFLNKPCPPETLVPALENGLKHFELLRVERELLEGTLAGSIKMLTDVLGMVAPDALGRGQRLRESMNTFARHLGAGPAWELDLTALLCNIGCAVSPPALQRKFALGAELTPAEQEVIRHTPKAGHDLLAEIPRLQPVARAILYQHARYDGSGFPDDGTAGDALPLASRMLKILNDRLDLEDDGVAKQRALQAMQARTGFYDPRLVEECFKCFADFLANPISADRPVLKLAVAQLEPADVVVSDIVGPSGFVLVRAGSSLTPMMLERLRNFARLGEVREPLLVQRGMAKVQAP